MTERILLVIVSLRQSGLLLPVIVGQSLHRLVITDMDDNYNVYNIMYNIGELDKHAVLPNLEKNLSFEVKAFHFSPKVCSALCF